MKKKIATNNGAIEWLGAEILVFKNSGWKSVKIFFLINYVLFTKLEKKIIASEFTSVQNIVDTKHPKKCYEGLACIFLGLGVSDKF